MENELFLVSSLIRLGAKKGNIPFISATLLHATFQLNQSARLRRGSEKPTEIHFSLGNTY